MSPSPRLGPASGLGPLNAQLQALRGGLRSLDPAFLAWRSDARGAPAKAKPGRIAVASERSRGDDTARVPTGIARVGPARRNSGGRPARVSAAGELNTSILGLLCKF
jgi:hypothetical protein